MANDRQRQCDHNSEHSILCDAKARRRIGYAIQLPIPTSYANAHFVRVTVATRRALLCADADRCRVQLRRCRAQAFAGLDSSICKVPPVMICNPQETGGSTTFNPSSPVKARASSSCRSATAPALGHPAITAISTPAAGRAARPGLRQSLGWGTAPGDCLPQRASDTKPGASTTVTDALNTRFDIYITTAAQAAAVRRRSIASRTYAPERQCAATRARCTIRAAASERDLLRLWVRFRARRPRRWLHRSFRHPWAIHATCAMRSTPGGVGRLHWPHRRWELGQGCLFPDELRAVQRHALVSRRLDGEHRPFCHRAEI